MTGYELPDFSRGLVLLGLDPSGNLVPVRLDADGRLSAFVVDTLDAWGEYLEVGNAELAARGWGSKFGNDRRGQVLFWYDARWAAAPFYLSASGGCTSERSAADSFFTGHSLHFVCNANDANVASADLDLTARAPDTGLGLQFRFKWITLGSFLNFSISYYDGANYWSGSGRLKRDAREIQVQDVTTGWEKVGNWDNTITNAGPWRYIKLVIDTENNTYLRLIVDSQEIDVTGYNLFTAASTQEHITSQIQLQGWAAQQSEVYVDDIVITTREL